LKENCGQCKKVENLSEDKINQELSNHIKSMGSLVSELTLIYRKKK
jgi:hypothetical protein